MKPILYLVEMTVSDLEKALIWYTSVLDCPPALIDRAHGFALIEPEGVRISLKQGQPAIGSTRLTFEVPHLETELARLADLGITPDGPLKVSEEGYHRARLLDPDGQPVSLFAWLPE